MGLVERRLRKVSKRLSALREELRLIDEQSSYLVDDAEDLQVRAAIETPGAAAEYRDAQLHVDAMARHRQHVVDEIAQLERTQDDLLDRLGG